MGYYHRKKMRPYGVQRAWSEEEDSLQTRTGARVRHKSKVRSRRSYKKALRLKVKRQIQAVIYDVPIMKRDVTGIKIEVR